ncbi:MAG: hypothetical protein J7J15_00660 [Candidatus Aenigmarchaeota archaeon]|nr:hypothetical protein [Candidatus Aenigmarchaeota archaeon]
MKYNFKEPHIDKIFPDQNQTGKEFKIEKFAKAIQKNGIIPIEVIFKRDSYKPIDEVKSIRICKKPNLKTSPFL